MASSIHVSNDCLFDTSWSLYRLTELQWPAQTLRSRSALAVPAQNLDTVLRKSSQGGDEYDEEDSDKAGGYQSSSWELIRVQEGSSNVTKGLLISIKFDRSTYKVVFLLDPEPRSSTQPNLPLLMLRTPTTLTRRVIRFFENDFSATIHPLRFSTPNLCDILENYIQTLSTLPSARYLPRNGRDTALQDLPSQMIRDLRITLAFAPPVAPHLKSLDIDLPFDTVWRMIRPEATTAGTNTSEEQGTKFLDRLAEHVNHAMGLNLPWQTSGSQDAEDLIRISRITCASFIIAADGKVKIVRKFAQAIQDDEMLGMIKEANDDILDALIRKAADHD